MEIQTLKNLDHHYSLLISKQVQDSMCVWIFQLSMCKVHTHEYWYFQKWVSKLAWMKYRFKIGWHHQGVNFHILKPTLLIYTPKKIYWHWKVQSVDSKASNEHLSQISHDIKSALVVLYTHCTLNPIWCAQWMDNDNKFGFPTDAHNWNFQQMYTHQGWTLHNAHQVVM
jgi:hypothetical protein